MSAALIPRSSDNFLTPSNPRFPYDLYQYSDSQFFSFSNEKFNVRLAYQIIKFPNTPTDQIPAILIIGSSRVKEDWYEFPFLLARQRPVLVFDNRGMGESTYSALVEDPDDFMPPAYSISDMADDTIRLVRHVFPNFPQVHFIGASLGGCVTQMILATPEYRKSVKSAVLACTRDHGSRDPHPPGAPTDFDALKRYWARRALTDDWVDSHPKEFNAILKISDTRERPDLGMVIQDYADEEFRVTRDQMKGITCPVLGIHGSSDKIVTLAMGEEMHQLLSHQENPWEFEKITGAGHNIWVTHGEEMRKSIENFLDKQK